MYCFRGIPQFLLHNASNFVTTIPEYKWLTPLYTKLHNIPFRVSSERLSVVLFWLYFNVLLEATSVAWNRVLSIQGHSKVRNYWKCTVCLLLGNNKKGPSVQENIVGSGAGRPLRLWKSSLSLSGLRRWVSFSLPFFFLSFFSQQTEFINFSFYCIWSNILSIFL